MKKLEKLSRAEMKNVRGGLHPDPCSPAAPCSGVVNGTLQFGSCLETCPQCRVGGGSGTVIDSSDCNSNIQ